MSGSSRTPSRHSETATALPLTMRKQPIWIIIFTIVLDTLGIGILVPTTCFSETRPRHTTCSPETCRLARATSCSASSVPCIRSCSSLPHRFWASSDRHGRKPILAISLAGTSFGTCCLLSVSRYGICLSFVGRALPGITGGNLSVAQAAIADVTAPKDRTKNFGLIGAAFGVGFILGPFLGGTLADRSVVSWFDAATPFWFAAILAAVNTLSVLFQLSETNQHIRMRYPWRLGRESATSRAPSHCRICEPSS